MFSNETAVETRTRTASVEMRTRTASVETRTRTATKPSQTGRDNGLDYTNGPNAETIAVVVAALALFRCSAALLRGFQKRVELEEPVMKQYDIKDSRLVCLQIHVSWDEQ